MSGADDEIDFRPFFDMVVGVLFVLLILVAAQVYFQQVSDQSVASEAAKRDAARRRADIAAFLDALAGRLRAGGLAAAADAAHGAVLLPLQDVLAADASGLPAVEGTAVGRLGAALADATACVTAPRSDDPGCSAFARLDLDALDVGVRLEAAPPGAPLAPDRYGELGASVLSARLLGEHPSLIGASNAAGGRVIRFVTAPAASPQAGAAAGAAPGLRGDLVLDFTFR
ncbi:hypothetical protein [Lichenibacterium dinghuense]|uniref:hypothetical protein n=1 Tax=Lichenibacterium dinghuense TaxID=2895977 RepID=UPI001F1A50CE|nr:hypothetical protein [Lichenibacterium sp. 6Y81]